MSKVSCARCGQYDGAHAAGCLFALPGTLMSRTAVAAATKQSADAAKTNEGAKGAPEVGKKVPHVTVNGRALTGAEVMTLHVALCAFFSELESGLGTDVTAQKITQGYKQCLQSIFRLMDL